MRSSNFKYIKDNTDILRERSKSLESMPYGRTTATDRKKNNPSIRTNVNVLAILSIIICGL